MLENATPMRGEVADDAYALRLAGAFGALVALTFGLIVLGALVRANDAGLACPDWPLCFGEVIPRMNLEVAFEWTHRGVAGALAVGFTTLTLLALRRSGTRAATGGLLAVGAALLALQVLLGALTVWRLLAAWTVTAHLIVGNSFALILLWTALALRDRARPGLPRAAAPLPAQRLLALVAVLLFAQMLLGGLVASRYAGLACPDWPSCHGGEWFPTWQGPVGLHLLHRINGYALFAALATAAFSCRAVPALRRISAVALGLVTAQIVVGIVNVWLRLPVEVTALHSALAAGLVLSVSLAVREAWSLGPASGR
jgi:cytochrome c oxidase assembly protein subunit 15